MYKGNANGSRAPSPLRLTAAARFQSGSQQRSQYCLSHLGSPLSTINNNIKSFSSNFISNKSGPVVTNLSVSATHVTHFLKFFFRRAKEFRVLRCVIVRFGFDCSTAVHDRCRTFYVVIAPRQHVER